MLKLLGFLILVIAAVAENCEPGWKQSLITRNCYKVTEKKDNFRTAARECADHGAEVTTVLHDEEKQALVGIIAEKIPKQSIWIGSMKMSKDHDAPKDYWMNGEEQAYSTWGDPWQIPGFFCTLLSPNGIMLHQWCQARLMHGICKRPFGTKTPRLKEPNCEDGWTGSRHTGKCYKLTGNKTNSMGFQETCLNWNGKGASVISYLEKEFIIELAESNGFNSAWLGAKRGPNGKFAWLDGNKFDGAYWSTDGPSTSGNDKNCLVLYSLHFDHLDSGHRWSAADCGKKDAVGVCKKDPIGGVTA